MLSVLIAIFGVIGSLVVADENDVEIDEILNFEDFEFEPPPIDVVTPEIEIDTRSFDARSCTRAVGRWLERLLKRQARGRAVQDIFTNEMPFPIGSFEFSTTVEIYASGRIQRAVTTGEPARAVSLARDRASRRCRKHYGD